MCTRVGMPTSPLSRRCDLTPVNCLPPLVSCLVQGRAAREQEPYTTEPPEGPGVKLCTAVSSSHCAVDVAPVLPRAKRQVLCCGPQRLGNGSRHNGKRSNTRTTFEVRTHILALLPPPNAGPVGHSSAVLACACAALAKWGGARSGAAMPRSNASVDPPCSDAECVVNLTDPLLGQPLSSC